MNLQQLCYLYKIARRDLNVSEAAAALHTSQPSVSKHERLLEEELSATIFVRSGKPSDGGHRSRPTGARDRRARGIKYMNGDFLAENRRMIQFVTSLGFVLSPHPEDSGLKRGVLVLD